MFEVLKFIGGCILLLIGFAVVTSVISLISEKCGGNPVDPFNVQEDDIDSIKMIKTLNTYDRVTNNGRYRNNSYKNMTNSNK